MPELKIPLISGLEVNSRGYVQELPLHMYAVIEKNFDDAYYMKTLPGYEFRLVTFDPGFKGPYGGAVYNERFEKHFRVDERVDGTNIYQFYEAVTDPTSPQQVDIGQIPYIPMPSRELSSARMPYSFNTQGILIDNKMFLYDGTSFTEVTDPDLGDPIDCIWIDGYYFYCDEENIYHSDISDEFSISGTKFATAEFRPDKNIGLARTVDNKVAVLGRYSIEYFQNIGSAGFAFRRIQALNKNIGAVSRNSFCTYNDDIYLIGGSKESNLSIYKINNGSGSHQKISNRTIDEILNDTIVENFGDMWMQGVKVNGMDLLLIYSPFFLVYNITQGEVYGSEFAWSKMNNLGDIRYGVYDPNYFPGFYFQINYITFGPTTYHTEILLMDEYKSSIKTTTEEKYPEISLFTPFIQLENTSIDKLEAETFYNTTSTPEISNLKLAITANGESYGSEKEVNIKDNRRAIFRRLGYVRDWVGFRLQAENIDFPLSITNLRVFYG